MPPTQPARLAAQNRLGRMALFFLLLTTSQAFAEPEARPAYPGGLKAPIDLRLEDVELNIAIDSVAMQVGLDVEFDQAALDAVGVSPDQRVGLRVFRVPAARQAALIVSQAGSGRARVLTDGQTLLITSDTVAEQKTQGRRGPALPGQWTVVGLSPAYEQSPRWLAGDRVRPQPLPLDKLLETFSVFSDGQATAKNLLEFYQMISNLNIVVDPVSLRLLNTSLSDAKLNYQLRHASVRQHLELFALGLTESGQAEGPSLGVALDAWGTLILANDARLRLLCGFGEDHDEASGLSYAERLAWLESAAFDNEPLAQVLKTVETWAGRPVVADWDDLQAHGIAPDTLVQLNLHPHLANDDDISPEALLHFRDQSDTERLADLANAPAGRLMHLLAATLGDGSARFVLDGDTLRLTTPQHAVRLLTVATGDARRYALPHWGVGTDLPYDPDEDHPYLTRNARRAPTLDEPARRTHLLQFVRDRMALRLLIDPLSDAEAKLNNAPSLQLNDATAAAWLDALVADTGLAWSVDPSRTLIIATPKRLELLAAPYGVLREPVLIELD
ncbi:MAG: hypothetical protein AAGI68_03275 [Planctomycetota bacterium]